MAFGSNNKVLATLASKGDALAADVAAAEQEAVDYLALAGAATERGGLSAKQAAAVKQALGILNAAGVTF